MTKEESEVFDKDVSDLTVADVKVLAAPLGIDLWGCSGEVFVYLSRLHEIGRHAYPFLVNDDRAGWEKFCEGRVDEL